MSKIEVTKEQLEEYLSQGLTLAKIGEMLGGFSRQTVQWHVHKYGIREIPCFANREPKNKKYPPNIAMIHARHKKNYSRVALALKMGVSKSLIMKIENGYKLPDAIYLGKLFKALEIDVDDLMKKI
jgi:DNA-binding XRE family transcriptional regulator